MSKTRHPLEDEYGPLDAFLIGAGHTTDNLLGQLKQGYYAARRNLGDASGSPETVSAYQAELDKQRRDQREKALLYRPMAKAYPMATVLGETLPAWVYGWRTALPTFEANVYDLTLADLVKATGKPLPEGGALRGLLQQ